MIEIQEGIYVGLAIRCNALSAQLSNQLRVRISAVVAYYMHSAA